MSKLARRAGWDHLGTVIGLTNLGSTKSKMAEISGWKEAFGAFGCKEAFSWSKLGHPRLLPLSWLLYVVSSGEPSLPALGDSLSEEEGLDLGAHEQATHGSGWCGRWCPLSPSSELPTSRILSLYVGYPCIWIDNSGLDYDSSSNSISRVQEKGTNNMVYFFKLSWDIVIKK